MEAVHQVIDGKILNQVVTLPKTMQDILVEIVVRPAEGQTKAMLTRNELRARLAGSHTESLSGVIQIDEDVMLQEFRAERRNKYECVD